MRRYRKPMKLPSLEKPMDVPPDEYAIVAWVFPESTAKESNETEEYDESIENIDYAKIELWRIGEEGFEQYKPTKGDVLFNKELNVWIVCDYELIMGETESYSYSYAIDEEDVINVLKDIGFFEDSIEDLD